MTDGFEVRLGWHPFPPVPGRLAAWPGVGVGGRTRLRRGQFARYWFYFFNTGGTGGKVGEIVGARCLLFCTENAVVCRGSL